MSRKSKKDLQNDLQKDLDAMLKEIENLKSTDEYIQELEKRINDLEFVVEMACEDLNNICHLMRFVGDSLEKENMQLSSCIAVIRQNIANVEISLLEETPL